MTTSVTTRAGKGARLTAAEVDANFTTVASAIDTEIAARASAITSAVAAEAAARAAADATLQANINGIIAASDAMVFKGVIDCGSNPNFPAGNRGDTYRVSVAGRIGGVPTHLAVEVGDLVICLDDGTSSGSLTVQGSHWTVVQTNLDGAVIGPGSATVGNLAMFSTTSGTQIEDASVAVDIDGTLAANSDAKLATQKAVKAYIDGLIAGLGGGSGELLKSVVSVTASALRDLNSTDIELVPAPGAGLMLIPDMVVFSLKRATPDHDSSGYLIVCYGASAGSLILLNQDAHALFSGSDSLIASVPNVVMMRDLGYAIDATQWNASTQVDNQPLTLSCDATVTGSGNGIMKITTYYRVAARQT